MIKSLRLIFTLVFITVSIFTLSAQESTINVFGTVKDELSGKKMADVTVTLEEDGVVKTTASTGINGKFEFILDYGHEYNIRFGAAGYIAKFITIDSKNVPDEDKIIGQAIDLDMSLFQFVEGINFDILKKPIGIARYDSNAGDVSFDYKYTRSIQEEIARLRRQLEEKFKEEEERLRKEKESAEKQRLQQEQFDKLVVEGDDQFSKGNYLNAVFKFSDALDLIPGVKYVEEKLAKAQAALEKQKKDEAANAKYTQLIASADAAFNNADYQNAVSTYEKAILLKNDQYPKDQIALAKVKLDKIAEQKAIDEQYNALITKADAAYKAESLEDALASYTKAVSVKPEQYPKDQIAKIEGVLKEKLEQAAIDLRYSELITAGDASFKEGKFNEAIGDYNKAIALKATEQYPKDQIAAAQTKLEEAAAAQAKEEQYKALITSADAKFKASDYTASISDYNKALALKATEQYPKDQIAAAQSKLDEAAANKAKEEQYKALITSADTKFKASDYTASISDYNKALALKATEQYPKDQIVAAQTKLEEAAAAQAKEEQYNTLITAADKKFQGTDYSGAIIDYDKAIALKGSEQYPKDQIKAAQAKLDEQAAAQAKEEQYKALITSADAKFKEADYSSSITDYNKAIALKSTEQYPKDQITAAQSKLDEAAANQAKEEQYKALISSADKKFKSEDYNAAIGDYQKAVALKATEQYPKDQITAAQTKLDEVAANRAKEEQYKVLIASADAKFKGADYTAAISEYQKAVALKASEQYPKDQIASAQIKLDEAAANQVKEEQYKALIASADAKFKGADYTAAISDYTKALGLKSGEQYPKDQIKAAQAKLDEQAAAQAKEEQYNALITSADAKFKEADYSSSITDYTKAISLKPTEQYPKDQIAAAQSKLDEAAAYQAKEEQYNTLITAADKKFQGTDYSGAITDYNKAITLKGGEQYPKDQIVKAKSILDEQAAAQAKEEQYKTLIASADAKFKGADYTASINDYQKAVSLKAEEQYPKDQITAAQIKLDELAAEQAKDKQYSALIASADAKFKASDYSASISDYNKALGIKSGEQYPKDQITAAQAKLDELAAEKEKEEQYNALVADADEKFQAAEYTAAISTYQSAIALKGTEQYPKDQVAKAQKKLTDLAKAKEQEEQYKALIASADTKFKADDFTASISDYQSALALKSGEQYPKDQIAAAQSKLDAVAAAQAKEEQYKALIASADAKFKASDYTASISDYNKALALKATEQYPKDQIAAAQTKLDEAAAVQAKEEQYKALIASADTKFQSGDYAASINDYNKALGIKSGEQYPKDQITAAQAKLDEVAAAKAKEEQYKNLIADADVKFQAADYSASISAYKKALTLKSEEQYPKDQIAVAQLKLDEIAAKNAKDAEYNGIIATADEKLAAQEYSAAIASYTKALGIKSEEQYPKDQIVKAEEGLKALEAQRKLNEQYNTLISAADKKFASTAYEAAILDYQQALTVKDEQYPKDQITAAKTKIAEIAQAKKTDKAYNDALAYADSQMEQKAYINAITSYEGASTLKPTEQYPKDQIAKANALLKAQDEAAAKKEASSILDNTVVDVPDEKAKVQSRSSFTDITKLGKIEDIPTDTIRIAEKPKNPTPKVMYKLTPDVDDNSFRKLLGENYPDGLTDEKYVEGNKTIYRSIYVQEKLGDEYLKVEARFGTFYFKNGSTISATDYNAYLATMK